MDGLPDELLLTVFGFVRLKDLNRLFRVCRRWRALVTSPAFLHSAARHVRCRRVASRGATIRAEMFLDVLCGRFLLTDNATGAVLTAGRYVMDVQRGGWFETLPSGNSRTVVYTSHGTVEHVWLNFRSTGICMQQTLTSQYAVRQTLHKQGANVLVHNGAFVMFGWRTIKQMIRSFRYSEKPPNTIQLTSPAGVLIIQRFSPGVPDFIFRRPDGMTMLLNYEEASVAFEDWVVAHDLDLDELDRDCRACTAIDAQEALLHALF